MTQFLKPLIIALSNVLVRGGLVKHWLPGFKGGRYLHALVFGLCFWSHGWLAVISASIGMYLGSSPALFKPATDQAFLVHKIGRWCGLVFARAFVWCLAVSLALAPFLGNGVWYFMACAPLMPMAYSPVWWFHRFGKVVNPWTLSELTWGIVMGLPFILLSRL